MDGYVRIGTELDTKGFDKEIAVLEDRLNDVKATLQMADEDKTLFSTREVKEMEAEAQKLGRKLDTLKQKQAQLGKADFSGIKSSLSSVGSSIEGIIQKVSRWALAVFGIRSAYLFVRQAMSTLSQYDEQMATNVEWIRYLLASALKPVIETIIQLAYTLLTYINYIAQAWFGVNLFANASTKAFQKQNKVVGGTVKKAKELQKTLAGFDEMNILQKDGSVGSGGGGGGASLPGLPNMDEVKIPGWIKWIAENKGIVLGLLGALATTFAISKIAKWISNLNGLSKALGFGSGGILNLLSTIATFGAIFITIMIAKAWWEDVQKFNKQLDEMRERGKKFQEDWIKGETDINKLISTGNVNRQAGYDLLEKSDSILARIGGENGYGYQLVKQAEQTAINIGKQVEKEVELLKKKEEETGITEETKQQEENIKQSIIEQIKYNLELKKAMQDYGMETSNVDKLNDGLITQYQNMGGQVNVVKDELGNINDIELKNKNLTIDIDANTEKAEKKTNNWLGDMAKNLLDMGITSLTGIWGSGYKMIKSLTNSKGAIYYPPKLAVGGVINQPGRGIPLGSAIGGEAGAEGVIPLTDSQQMELLGEAIGRYISINLTNITELDGRQIARKVDKVRNNENFVMNR